MLVRLCHGLTFGLLLAALMAIQSPASAAEPVSAESDTHAAAADAHASTSPSHGEAAHGQNPNDLGHVDSSDKLEDPTDFKADLALYTLVVFLCLLAILGKFAWGPIVAGLDKREQAIAAQIDEAKQDAEKAREQLQQYEVKLAGAADDVRALLEQGRKDADALKQKMVADAKEAANVVRDKAVSEIEAAKNRTPRHGPKSVDTAIELAGNIVRRQLTTEDHAALVKEALQRLPSEN